MCVCACISEDRKRVKEFFFELVPQKFLIVYYKNVSHVLYTLILFAAKFYLAGGALNVSNSIKKILF